MVWAPPQGAEGSRGRQAAGEGGSLPCWFSSRKQALLRAAVHPFAFIYNPTTAQHETSILLFGGVREPTGLVQSAAEGAAPRSPQASSRNTCKAPYKRNERNGTKNVSWVRGDFPQPKAHARKRRQSRPLPCPTHAHRARGGGGDRLGTCHREEPSNRTGVEAARESSSLPFYPPAPLRAEPTLPLTSRVAARPQPSSEGAAILTWAGSKP